MRTARLLILLATASLSACASSRGDTRADDTAAAAPAGDMVRGGQLFDTWWKVKGATRDAPPDGTNPDYAGTQGRVQGPATWRCKECHGWDYLGRDGAYASGSHFSGVSGVDGARKKPASNLLSLLGSGDGARGKTVGTHFSPVDRADLVAFLRQGTVDLRPHLEDTTRAVKNADAAHGATLFQKVCAECHGNDGKDENFGSAEAPEYVGTVARKNPWEFIHKVRFGQPGTDMPSAIKDGWSLQDVLDVLAHAQSLPAE